MQQEIVSAMGRIQDQSTSNPSSITQAAGVEALNGPQEAVELMRVEFEKRRNYIVAALNDISGITCNLPAGAFYVFPNVSSLYGRTYSESLAEYLLEQSDVAVVPGSGFGADGYLRLSYATSLENIVKGVKRISEAIGRLE